MVRIRVQVREDQVRALERRAAARRVSMAELIREAIDRWIERDDEEDARWKRALSVVGKFHSDVPDLAERHDDYLPDAYLE
jgi:hypothetical protein